MLHLTREWVVLHGHRVGVEFPEVRTLLLFCSRPARGRLYRFAQRSGDHFYRFALWTDFCFVRAAHTPRCFFPPSVSGGDHNGGDRFGSVICHQLQVAGEAEEHEEQPKIAQRSWFVFSRVSSLILLTSDVT